MPFDPGVHNLIPEIIAHTTGDLEGSLAEYRKRQSQRNFNSNAFETILSQYPGAVPPDVISKFHGTTNPDAQSGIVVNLVNKIKQDTDFANAQRLQTGDFAGRAGLQTGQINAEALRQQAALDAEKARQAERIKAAAPGVAAQANVDEAKAWGLWTGAFGGENPSLTLSQEELATGKAVGMAPLRQSRNSFIWAPNPALTGGRDGEWVKDPNDPTGTKYIGWKATGGDMKFLPRPSDLVELVTRGIIPNPLKEGTATAPLQAAQTPVPTATPDKYIVGKQYKDAQGNVATYKGNGQWQ